MPPVGTFAENPGRWWLQPGSVVARKVFIPLDIVNGRLSYALSRVRRSLRY